MGRQHNSPAPWKVFTAARRIEESKLLTATAILCALDWLTTQLYFLRWASTVPLQNIGEANPAILYLVSIVGPWGVSLYMPFELLWTLGFVWICLKLKAPIVALLLLGIFSVVIAGNVATVIIG